MQTTSKTLAKWAAASVFCAILSVAFRLTADGQVPIIASFLHWNTSTTLSSQGGYLGWNRGGLGESDFENVQGTGVGGYNWYNGSGHGLLMALDSSGNLTANSFIGPVTGNLTGNVSGSLTGNASGTNAQYGNLVLDCNGCGGVAWNPGSFTSGTWFGLNNNGGSNGETDFINRYTAGNIGGFSWWSTTASTLSSQIMNLSNAGVLTLSSVHASLVGNVTGNVSGNGNGTWTGPVAGNASTATALAASPGNCGTNSYPSGVNASGTAQNCSSALIWATSSSINATGSSAGATATTTLNWDSPGFSGAPSRFVCSGISPTGAPQGPYVTGITGSTITVQISNGTASQAVASSFGSVTCWGRQ